MKNNIPSNWNEKSIEDVTDYVDYRGKTPQKVESGVFLITARNIKDGRIDYKVSKEYISKEDYDEVMRRGIPKVGDVLITTEAPLGNVAQIDDASIALAQRIIKYRGKLNILDNDYLKFYLSSDIFQSELIKKSTGSTVKGIKGTVLHKMKIIFPPLKEQQKIAEILSTWDLSIEKQENLIEKKKEFKRGLMQRLLGGEVRFKEFNDKWKKDKLEKFIEPISRECDKPCEGYWRLGLRSHGKGTFHQFVDDPTKVSMDKLYNVKANDLIVNITFAWEHAIAIADSGDEGKLVSHRFPTYQFKHNAYPKYFKYYILQSRFREMLVNISPGGAGRNRVMNKKDFLKLEVLIPSYDEQKRIAEVLISADKEIELLEKELEALKLQKKGLMQRLLTGEVRVKV